MKKIMALLMAVIAAGALTWAADAPKPTSVDLTGTLGCGHCTFHKTSSCAAALKVADGKIYVIDNATPEVMAAREDATPAKVSGTVTEKGGVLHIQATKQELVK